LALVPGARIGSYEIVAALGAGGMGEVYRATDTKLKRQVAIKILPPSLAADADRLARFQREAEVLASLNHPHIAAIYGLETTDGGTALVMELVAGEDLSERISRGPVPLDEALPIARQIADALEAAHEQGIIHRDLKPANIKVRADGTVKVLDFGLAKAMAPTGSSPDVLQSPTITTPAMMTGAGVILGTAAYMSPEQARGKVAGKRADIWAFGCVLYELLAGRRVFEADEVADVLARVLTQQPDWSLLPPTLPAGIQRLLNRCLEKDPKRRLADIADARLEIDDAPAGKNEEDRRVPALAARQIGPSGPTKVAWAVAALFAASALGLGIAMMRQPVVADAPVYRSTILVNETLSRRAPSHRFRLSPDGHRLAYIAADATGRTMLWVRPLDNLAGRPLAGTDDANAPFWSPDSRFVAFFADAKLKRIDAAGGPVTVICDAPASTGRRMTPGSWNRQDVILIPSRDSPTIARVAAGGGTPSAVTTLEANGEATQHGFPFFLPDGQRFLYVAYSGLVPLGMYVGSLAGEPPVRLMDTGSDGQYANGSLLFVRGTTLMAQRFDPTTLALSGEAVAIGDRVGMNISFMRAGAFSVSETGALVYQGYGEGQTARLVWSDRNGNKTAVLDERLPYRDLRLSPDGLRAAVSLANPRDNMSDVWIVSTVRGLRTRFTFDATDEFSPVWSHDGADIAFSSRRKGHLDLYRKTASGADREDVLLNDAVEKTPTSWSPDGKFVLYSIDGAKDGT